MKMLSQQENVLLPGARGFRAPASAEIDPAHLGKGGPGCLPRVQGEDLKKLSKTIQLLTISRRGIGCTPANAF